MRTRRLPRRFQPLLDVLPDRISPSDIPFLEPPSDMMDPGFMLPPVLTIPGCTPGDDEAPVPEVSPVEPEDSANSVDVVGADNYAFWMSMGPF